MSDMNGVIEWDFENIMYNINNEINLDLQDKNGRSALMWACNSGAVELIKILICMVLT